MASNIQSYVPRFTCRKCSSPINIFDWRKGELCAKCRGLKKGFH